MGFDFDAAVGAPFRMQPGLRRCAPGAPLLTAAAPGGRHQREKLAVLSAFWPQALCVRPGFDAAPALAALFTHAAAEQPAAWQWDGARAHALQLGTAVDARGRIEQTAPGRFGLGDEVARCLQGLPAPWRATALLSLAFEEDFALVDAADATIPWLAVALPSHWAPERKLGLHFAQVHAPVADNQRLLRAADSLVQLVSGVERWERFVWTVTDHPRLHAHPERVDAQRWRDTPPARAWFRTEHQCFLPLAGRRQTVFTIRVGLQPLAAVVHGQPARAAALHAAIGSMSEAVLAYRGLAAVRLPLLAWLAERAAPVDAPVAAELGHACAAPAGRHPPS